MRLNSIKLSGFKSFAEPTHFQLPGQLVGVVGPNGCGKSNIMDAVRWVLGESKASELRGESMQDVIFNGSGNRKPASRASVELVFDNSDARAGGPWNQFREIAVKRVLTRDGNSSYHINQQVVRRRDVQDVFMGTGLGPRAYAIIGQGTISRIIESKPEELRLFLEEAAGVSKYKERRRETENRLKDTRENLTRVDDILRELNGNLERLERQAEVASRYRDLQVTGELKLHQLWFLKQRDAGAEEARLKRAVAEAATTLDARVAELRHVEAELETVREAHYAASDGLHASQGRLAQASLEVSRLEERRRYVAEGRQRLEARRVELLAQQAGWALRGDEAAREVEQLVAQLDRTVEQAEVLAAQVEEHAGLLPAVEDALRRAQSASATQRGAVTAVQQQIQVLAVEDRGIEEQSRQFQTRRERLAAERRGLVLPDLDRLAALTREHADAVAAHDVAQARLHELTDAAPLLDQARREAQERANKDAAAASSLQARLDALRALQERVQTQGKLKPWLDAQGLGGLQGLWTQLHIETGWEPALEAALRERLSALQVSRLDSVGAFARATPPARLAFYTPPAAGHAPAAGTLPRLAALVRCGDAGLAALIDDWLHGVYTAGTIDEALALRTRLAPGDVVMTREGHAVSVHSVSFYAPDSEQAGLLARAQEIENLDRQVRAESLMAEASRAALVRADAAAAEAAQQLTASRRETAEAQTQAHRLQVELLQLTQQAEASRQRGAQLADETTDIEAQLDELAERRASGAARLEELDVALGAAQERHAELDEQVIGAERRLAQARDEQRRLERDAQEMQFQQRALQARRDEQQRNAETAAQQRVLGEQTALQIDAELAQLAVASDDTELQVALDARGAAEAALAEVRSRYDDLSAKLRRADEQRMAHEQSLQPMRDRIGALQLEEQASRLGGAQYAEQLAQAGVDLTVLAASVEAGNVRLTGLQSEIDRINREIAALGAVNLAALEELTTSRERKTFLDAQLADLGEAIGTLEGAIKKIDLETRDLLGETFRQVNQHFGEMFPKLFGGGTAKLVMTGDEILDAGVQVLAQPPGKKNSTIHLLSGGEKALTAIALVFAIFQLNPAPFCLLDEVDAPLDDANTERYSRLVDDMSKSTQFLFISHNKIAMEMAEQLIGVTMQEQGVSRIVAVDMDAAVTLIAA